MMLNMTVTCIDPSKTTTKGKTYRGRGVFKGGTIRKWGVPPEEATHVTIQNDNGKHITLSLDRFKIDEQEESKGFAPG